MPVDPAQREGESGPDQRLAQHVAGETGKAPLPETGQEKDHGQKAGRLPVEGCDEKQRVVDHPFLLPHQEQAETEEEHGRQIVDIVEGEVDRGHVRQEQHVAEDENTCRLGKRVAQHASQEVPERDQEQERENQFRAELVAVERRDKGRLKRVLLQESDQPGEQNPVLERRGRRAVHDHFQRGVPVFEPVHAQPGEVEGEDRGDGQTEQVEEDSTESAQAALGGHAGI